MIRFPRMHIAESVVNRILNTADAVRAERTQRAADALPAAPAVPDPSQQSAELDAGLRQPIPSMPPVEGNPAAPADAAFENVAQGNAPIDGILNQLSSG